MCCPFSDWVQALAAAGITPSTSKTYTLSAIQKALTTMHGASVYLGCSSGKLNQVWYFYNVKGNAIDGTYKAVDTRKFYRLLFSGFFADLFVLFSHYFWLPKDWHQVFAQVNREQGLICLADLHNLC